MGCRLRILFTILSVSPMPKHPSLRSRLIWLVVAAVGASTIVATTVSVSQQVSSYSAMRRQALVATAQVFAAAVGPATAAKSQLEAFQALRAIGGMSDIQQAEIRTRDGRVLAVAGASVHLVDTDLSIDPDQEVSVAALLASGTIQVRVPIVNAGEPVGDLVVFGGIADLWAKLITTSLLTIAGGAVALLVGLVVALRLQRRITGPIYGLVDAMAAVRRTHRYDVAVPDATDREVGALVMGFNDMLRDVRERDDRLAAHRQNLEQEVADRTRDLAAARDVAEQANRAKSDFLATMSHEIRTPMNGIMVMADILNGGTLPPRQRRYADIIARSGRGLLSIINDILDFSKIEAGKLALEDIDVDLNEIAENVVGLFAEQARQKGVDLSAWVDPALPRSVRGDPVRLTQVATNLVNNALKFTAAGSVKLSIGFAAADRGAIEIAVRDSGIGIPPDRLDSIFESFSQVDQSTTRQFGGTGLGLTICKRLAVAMGGDIRVTSTVGEGSTFSVVFPCRGAGQSFWPRLDAGAGDAPCCIVDVTGEATTETLAAYLAASGFEVARRAFAGDVRIVFADPSRIEAYATHPARPVLIALADFGHDGAASPGLAAATVVRPVLRSEIEALLACIVRGAAIVPASGAAKASTARPAPFAPFNVLVADDNVVNREVAHEALRGLGGSVTLAENGVEAVAAMTAGRFDIVFMDGSMPEMDGLAAARRIRELEAAGGAARTPIVGLTAHVVGVEAQQWRDAGMDAVVYKPFTIVELVRTIETLLPHLERETPRDAAAPARIDVAPPSGQGHAGVGALIDEDTFAQLTAMRTTGHDDFAGRIVALYEDNAPLALAQIEQAVAAGDRDGCGRAAHSLKSMSLNIGAPRVARAALEIETLVREQGALPSAAVVAAMRQAFAETVREIRARISGGDHAAATPRAPASRPDPDAMMERALEGALARDEFSLAYQPIMDRVGLGTVGVEALLRWRRDTGEQVAPNIFIPVAERTGLIHDLGNWVMRRAFDDARAFDGIDVSINVSPVQLMRDDFVARTERAIAESGLDPARVVLEITESTLLSAASPVHTLMSHLNAAGFRFALDDFGTGYASLTSLRRYPFDRIKIDRSFVGNLHTAADAAIVHAVIAIAKSLGLKVVAEGVEQAEQQRFLTSAGVNFMQGFLFGRPMPKHDILARLSQERQTPRAAQS